MSAADSSNEAIRPKLAREKKPRQILRIELLLLWLSICLAAIFIIYDFSTKQLRLEIDTSPRALLPKEDRIKNAAARYFPESDPVIVSVKLPRGNQSEQAAQLKKWHDALISLKFAESVNSLHSVVIPVPEDGWVNMKPVGQILKTSGEDALANEIDKQPALKRLYDPLTRRMAFHIELVDNLGESPTEIRREIQSALGNPASIQITGATIIESVTSEALLAELKRCAPIALIGGLVLLLLVLQRPILVLMPLACASAVVLWTCACAVLLGMTLNLLTVLLPALLLALGLAYSLQGLCELQTSRVGSIRDRLIVSQGIAGVTTVVGFASLAITPLAAVREFAILAALGTACAVINTLILCPVVGHAIVGDALPGERPIRYAAAMISRYVRQRRVMFLVLGGLLMASGILGAQKLEVGSSLLSGLPKTSEWRQDFQEINDRFGGATAFSIYIDGHINGAMTQPEHLQAVDALQTWLQSQKVVGTVVTGSDLVADLHRNVREESDRSRFPENDNAIRQLLVLTGGSVTKQFFDQRFRRMRISVTTKTTETTELAEFKGLLDRELKKLPKSVSGSFDGTSLRMAAALEQLAESQWSSLLLASLGIFACLAALFTSARVAFVALWPNLLPVIAYFGFLGAADIRLSPATSVVGCIVLGLAVDDTVHFMTRFNTYARRTGNDRKAARMSLSRSLRAVTLTSMIMIVGCLSLAQSDLEESALFGTLAASALLLALILDLTVTPALLGHLRVATLWDALRMNIGGNSQFDQFQLFNGMSKRQARLFVSMADFVNLEPNTELPTHSGEEMELFVVLSGELGYVIQESNIEVAKFGKGSVVGVNQQTENNRALKLESKAATRLLHYNTFNLDRLRRRYPKIAALALKNLAMSQHDQIERLGVRGITASNAA